MMKTLKKNYEFKNVLTKGKYYAGKNIQVFIKSNHKAENRIGIAISSKIAKATKRNQIKRKIRENYRLFENQLKSGYDIVFLWKKGRPTEEATFWNVKEDFENIIFKSNLLKETK